MYECTPLTKGILTFTFIPDFWLISVRMHPAHEGDFDNWWL